MSPQQRSALMARIRGRDTGPEKAVAAMLGKMKFSPKLHAKDIPGRPDFSFPLLRLTIFVDGDFWHGWRFHAWRHKLAPFWAAKIDTNRKRDIRNRAKLRRKGWLVLRIWEHEVEEDPGAVADRIRSVMNVARLRRRP